MLKRFIDRAGPAVLLAAGLLFITTPGLPAAEPIEGVDYVLIEPHAVADPSKIEVIEFFYYGCESCNRLEPLLQSWLKTRSGDTSFRRVPALRRVAWVPLTRIYFALEQLGELERLHVRVYQAIHVDGLNLANSSELDRWAHAFGLDSARLNEILDSDRIKLKVQRARDATIAYGIHVTPSFVVDGRYMTNGRMAESLQALLATVDGLIEKARTTRLVK